MPSLNLNEKFEVRRDIPLKPYLISTNPIEGINNVIKEKLLKEKKLCDCFNTCIYILDVVLAKYFDLGINLEEVFKATDARGPNITRIATTLIASRQDFTNYRLALAMLYRNIQAEGFDPEPLLASFMTKDSQYFLSSGPNTLSVKEKERYEEAVQQLINNI